MLQHLNQQLGTMQQQMQTRMSQLRAHEETLYQQMSQNMNNAHTRMRNDIDQLHQNANTKYFAKAEKQIQERMSNITDNIYHSKKRHFLNMVMDKRKEFETQIQQQIDTWKNQLQTLLSTWVMLARWICKSTILALREPRLHTVCWPILRQQRLRSKCRGDIHMSLRIRGHTVTLTSPRCALRRRYM